MHEVLLSGSVGSAKSVLMAHLVVTHCLNNPGAVACLGRKALPDLKSTIFAKILEHIDVDYTEGRDYWVNHTSATIKFFNGSKIISRSWSDKRYKKVRSLELSCAVIEELTENNLDDKEIYDEIKMRVGRIPGIKENFIVCATNPDSPGHWVHKYFMDSDSPTRHVFYSSTAENPFLPEWYRSQLERDLDPKMYRRMVLGEWLEISTETVYYSYDPDNNYSDKSYIINPNWPIHLTWDFNIGYGKPFSMCLYQFDVLRRHFHFFNEVVVEGARTLDSCEELMNRGLLNPSQRYLIHGDATGRARTTKSIHTDYEIIEKFFSNVTIDDRRINYDMIVGPSNPPIRERHNVVNAYCENAAGKHRLTVYKDAPTLNEGFRFTSLKKGGDYIEDDSYRAQHVTTAAGYGIVDCHNEVDLDDMVFIEER